MGLREFLFLEESAAKLQRDLSGQMPPKEGQVASERHRIRRSLQGYRLNGRDLRQERLTEEEEVKFQCLEHISSFSQ